VFVTKYRNKCFTNDILNRAEEIFRGLCENAECELVEFSGEEDHVHLVISLHPSIEPAKLINTLKTVSSRYLRKEYADHLRKHYWKPALWSRAYCLLSVGGAPLSVLKDYVRNQNRPD
jgi:putative transposase